jgi:hypothetical protein
MRWDTARIRTRRSTRPTASDRRRLFNSRSPSAPVPSGGSKLVPGGVQPDLNTPTLILVVSSPAGTDREYRFTVGYVGNHGFHEIVGVDANEPFPVICPAAPCPATYPSSFSLPELRRQPGSRGNILRSDIHQAQCRDRQHVDLFLGGHSSYNALQIDLNHRFSSGFVLRGVYTRSKTLDDGDSVNATTSGRTSRHWHRIPSTFTRTRVWRISMSAMWA